MKTKIKNNVVECFVNFSSDELVKNGYHINVSEKEFINKINTENFYNKDKLFFGKAFEPNSNMAIYPDFLLDNFFIEIKGFSKYSKDTNVIEIRTRQLLNFFYIQNNTQIPVFYLFYNARRSSSWIVSLNTVLNLIENFDKSIHQEKIKYNNYYDISRFIKLDRIFHIDNQNSSTILVDKIIEFCRTRNNINNYEKIIKKIQLERENLKE